MGVKAESTPLDNVYRTGQAVGYFTLFHIFHQAVNTFIGAEKEFLQQIFTFYFCRKIFFFSVEKNDGLHIRFCSMNTVFTSFHTPRRFCAATTTAAATTVTTMTSTTAATTTTTTMTPTTATATATVMTATPTAVVPMKHLRRRWQQRQQQWQQQRQ